MGDHHHGEAVPGQTPHDVQHLAHQLRVQGGGGLVKEQRLGVHGQGPGDGHPLLLAAREHAGISVGLAGQSHLLQQLHGGALGLGLVHLLDLHRGGGDVGLHRLQREQVEALEHHAHLLPELADVVFLVQGVLTLIEDGAAGGGLQLVDAAQQCALAGARGADDAHHFSLFDLQIDVPKDLQVSKILGQMLYFYHLSPSVTRRSVPAPWPPDIWRCRRCPGRRC